MPAKTHDPTFKRLFGDPEHAAALVRHSLPGRIVDRLDLSTMVREPASFVDDQLNERYSDLLFSVTSTRGSVFVYLLIEHQSSNDPDMVLRLLEYMVRIWTDQRRRDPSGPLSPIIPLLICHPPGGWTAPRRLDELFDHDPDFAAFIPSFEVPIQDLEFLGDDEIKAWSMDVCRKLALWMLRDSRTAQRFRDSLPGWQQQLEEAASSATGLELLAVLFRYLLKVDEVLESTEIRAKIHELSPAAGRVMMTTEQKLIQQGLTQGREEGRAEGRIELLMRLLAVKFGELAENYRQRLARASFAELDTWAERVLGANTLEDVFTD